MGRKAQFSGQLQGGFAGDPFKAATVGGIDLAVFDKEDIGTRGLGEIALLVGQNGSVFFTK